MRDTEMRLNAQFKNVEKPGKKWCEILEDELNMIEEVKNESVRNS